MSRDIQQYHDQQMPEDKIICELLYKHICQHLAAAERKVWHAHPVWFLDGNPVVGYSKQKAGIRLMFWSGADFDEDKLAIRGEKFKDASIFYRSATEINPDDIRRWLEKAQVIQWDYKNLVKRKGVLIRIENQA